MVLVPIHTQNPIHQLLKSKCDVVHGLGTEGLTQDRHAVDLLRQGSPRLAETSTAFSRSLGELGFFLVQLLAADVRIFDG